MMSMDRRSLIRNSGVAGLGLVSLHALGGMPTAEAVEQMAAQAGDGGPTEGVTRALLQHIDVPPQGWDIYQTRVEIPVGKQSGRHPHPTGPEVGYVIRGKVAMEFDDRPTVISTGQPFLI